MPATVEYKLILNDSPLASASMGAIDQFINFVQDANAKDRRQGVLVHCEVSHQFLTREFVDELKYDIYFDEMFERILRLQYLARLIQGSHHTWVFAHSSDCLGSLFDLALAFDRRLCFNSRARLGFPSMSGGVFPFLGPFIDRYGKSARRRGMWTTKNVLRAPDAVVANLLSFATDHENWDNDARQWVERLVASESSVKAKNPTEVEAPVADQELQRALAVVKYDENLRQPQAGKLALDRAWSLAAQMRPHGQRELLSTIAYLSARTLVSRRFTAWADRHFCVGGGVHWLEPLRSKVVYVDLSQIAPPVKPLIRLMESGFKIIFCEPDGARLKQGIDLMYARFETYFAKDQAQRIWQEGAAWFTGQADEINNFPMCQWFPNDRVTVRSPDGELTFLRFLGNRASAECGWAELPITSSDGQEKFHKSYEIARIMSDGIIKTQRIIDGKVDLSTVVRSLFLEEVLRVSSILIGATGKLLPALKDAGWGYIADDNSWEYFLRAREEVFSVDPTDVRLGSMVADPVVWKMAIWREGRELARTNTKPERTAWNPVYISRHFATFAGLIAGQVHSSGAVRDRQEADRFVCACLGFPENLGTPLAFVEVLGETRFRTYCARFWPQHLNA